ncbi:MAG: Gfo/Idh/MocA family oxidoreductase [Lachnospiraceae bacterium]|nr:Gfo/Idh/MocA family oxidoreductase [Lachnospiraceae bacterium]
MIRFATIGTGFVVDWFLEGITACKEMEYAAVYSRSMETGRAFAQKYHVETVYDHMEDLAMDETIDAVYIASPPSCHFGQIMMMLNYGKHVLCEKPAVSNSKELELVLQAAQENDVVFLEAMKNVYTPGFRMIEELLPRIGTVKNAFIQTCRRSSAYDHFQKGIVEHVFLPKLSNGALMDVGCYAVHFLVKLFGMPQSIKADGIRLSNGSDGAGVILAQYQDMQAEILYSKMYDTEIPSQIQGEWGCMLIPDISHTREIRIVDRNGREELYNVPGTGVEDTRNDLVYEALEFQRLIMERRTDHPYHQNTVMTFQIMDEARRQMGMIFPADKIMEVL